MNECCRSVKHSNRFYIVAEKSSQKVAEKSSHSGYARLPREIVTDTSLSHSAVRVYAFIALNVKHGTAARLGQRLIAKKTGMDRGTVATAITELVQRNHIVAAGTGARRKMYHLTSLVFGQKQRDGVTEVVSAPSGGQRYASIGEEVA